MAVNYRPADSLFQVYLSSTSQITLVTFQQDLTGATYFYQQTAFTGSSNNLTIPLATNGDYLLFKQPSQPFLYLIPVCTTNYIYNASSLLCSKCPDIYKSFGVQQAKCNLCAELTPSTPVQSAQFNTLCKVNAYKSRVLVIFVPIFTFVCGLGCCLLDLLYCCEVWCCCKYLKRNGQESESEQESIA